MPPTRSCFADPSLPHLSEIIKLEPEKDLWCAGYAPSKRRRCHIHTYPHSRRSAVQLLNEGTKELRAGRDIDDLLEDLAPHVLCRTWHQYQASELASLWQRQVRSFISSRLLSTPARRPARQLSGAALQGTLVSGTDEQYSILYQRLYDTMEELGRIQRVRHLPAAIQDPPLLSGARQITGNNNANTIRNTSTSNSSSTSTESRISTRTTNMARNQRANIARVRPAHPAESEPVDASDIRSDTTLTMNIMSNGTHHRADPTTVPIPCRTRPTRRAVEGDCGICLCPLQESQSDSVNDSKKPEDGVAERYHENSDDSGDKTEEGSSASKFLVELVWCKAKCGVNFHAKCIAQWLTTSQRPTCPTCRSTWRG